MKSLRHPCGGFGEYVSHVSDLTSASPGLPAVAFVIGPEVGQVTLFGLYCVQQNTLVRQSSVTVVGLSSVGGRAAAAGGPGCACKAAPQQWGRAQLPKCPVRLSGCGYRIRGLLQVRFLPAGSALGT